MSKLIKHGEEWVHIETGEVFTQKKLIEINNKKMFESHNDYMINSLDHNLERGYKLTKVSEKENSRMVVKEGYKFNMIHRTDMKELFLSNKLSNHDKQFIGVLSPFISYPYNDIKIINEYLPLEELGRFIGISKNVMTKTIKNLEQNEVIKVVKGGNKPPTIYFNPFLICAGRDVEKDTYMMFCKSIYNPDVAYYCN